MNKIRSLVNFFRKPEKPELPLPLYTVHLHDNGTHIKTNPMPKSIADYVVSRIMPPFSVATKDGGKTFSGVVTIVSEDTGETVFLKKVNQPI